MLTEDQSHVIAWLASPSTHGGAPVERIDTHGSIVFLAGPRALKLKRAVRYDYLDFSTAERRRAMCEAELRINQPAAPGIYRGVVAVTREPDGSLAIGGSGTPVDWLVEMSRFDQGQLLDRLAARGELPVELMRPLAAAVARFHGAAERCAGHGGAVGMAWVIEGNAAGLAEQGARFLDGSACDELTSRALEGLERHRSRLEARRVDGFVRRCHGDLHLRNIVRLDGRPTLFDAVEFNDDIACVDVAYDLAFLLMDLWRRGLPTHANAVWNGYLSETDDLGGIAPLPLFLSCRAAVRAKTTATAANLQDDPRLRGELDAQAREYLAMAHWLLQPVQPCMVAIGGLSGSGKSTLAAALAAHLGAVPGAVVVRSDEVRKRLCGVPPLQRLGPEGYSPEVSRRVYETIARRMAQITAEGQAAVVDAVFGRPADREAIARAAAEAQVPMVGLWLEAPAPVLVARADARRLDVSDADGAVVRDQLAQDPGPIGWCRLDASRPFADVLRRATLALGERLPPGAIRVGPRL